MGKIKKEKITSASMSLTEVELKAVKILIEERLRRSCNEIKDLKGLCKIHDKIEVAQLQFEQIPF